MKRYIVGDIHGCYEELKELLRKIEHDAWEQDYKIIFVGDYVDRGPNSKEVVECIMHLQKGGHVALMGNHEDMLLAGEWSYAAETFRSFNKLPFMGLPEDVTEWMKALPKYYEDDTIIVAHAGVKPGIPMDEQTDIFLLWYRYQQGGRSFLNKHLYHGHTPHTFVEQAEDRTNVDTACVYNGHLTAAVVGDDGKPIDFIQVQSKQVNI